MTIDGKINLLHSLSKEMKCEYVVVRGNIIYGTDENFVHVSYIRHNEIDLWDLQDRYIIAKPLSDGEIKEIDDYKIFRFMKLLDSFSLILQNIPISFYYEKVSDREDFKSIINKKAAEGLTKFQLDDDHMMFISKSLVPINKKDNLDINVRDIDNDKFLGEFIISKGKLTIYKSYMFMNLKDNTTYLM